MNLLKITAACLIIGAAPQDAGATDMAYDPGPLLAAQHDAVSKLAMFDGEWRGPATIHMPDGKRVELIQTERFGPMLGGTLRIVEGRGHDAKGEIRFNALGVVSYSPQTKSYSLRSYAQGYAGDFPLELIENGFVWSIKAGPVTMRYTATVSNGEWHEIGERVIPGKAPAKMFEMRLRRIGDTTWPAEGGVPPR